MKIIVFLLVAAFVGSEAHRRMDLPGSGSGSATFKFYNIKNNGDDCVCTSRQVVEPPVEPDYPSEPEYPGESGDSLESSEEEDECITPSSPIPTPWDPLGRLPYEPPIFRGTYPPRTRPPYEPYPGGPRVSIDFGSEGNKIDRKFMPY